ncbi:DUF1493 family protein [Salmonella enterica]
MLIESAKAGKWLYD